MTQIKISVILIYNNEQNLKGCVESILRQSFSDIELICVSNAASQNAQDIIKQLSTNEDKIQLINLPIQNEIKYAQKIAIGVASGDFICFIDNNEILESDFLKNLYFELVTPELIKIQNKYLYRRTFLENDKEISQLIQEKIEKELLNSQEIIEKQKQEIKKEFENFNKNNVETIKNNSYELICRFNQLEKLFYDKDYGYQQKIDDAIKNFYENKTNDFNKIYEDISKVYDYINSEINKKGMEINKVYEEITKNYNYTEQLVDKKTMEAQNFFNNDKNIIWQKIHELEKEIIVRYVNIKRLLDVQMDEIKLQIQTGQAPDGILEKNVEENINNICSKLNNLSSVFYEELSKIYKEMNEKLIKTKEDDKYYFEQKMNEMKIEFETKLQNLKEELSK
jgi:glycosyltransferase involved in cell wall biosynthesis